MSNAERQFRIPPVIFPPSVRSIDWSRKHFRLDSIDSRISRGKRLGCAHVQSERFRPIATTSDRKSDLLPSELWRDCHSIFASRRVNFRFLFRSFIELSFADSFDPRRSFSVCSFLVFCSSDSSIPTGKSMP